MAAAGRWARVFAGAAASAPGGAGARCVKLGWCMSGSALAVEALATAGFDAVCVDCQHGAAGAGSEAALHCVRSAALSGAVPVARAPASSAGGVDLPAVGWLLDAGARCVIAPLIHTPEEARAFVGACNLPGEAEGVAGTRSWGAFAPLARGEPGGAPIVTIAMIETDVVRDAAALDEIAATPGLDALFVGTNDLALALGLGTSALLDGDAAIMEAIGSVRAAARRRGVRVGLFCPPSVARFWSTEGGMDIVAPGADLIHLRSAAAAAAAEVG